MSTVLSYKPLARPARPAFADSFAAHPEAVRIEDVSRIFAGAAVLDRLNLSVRGGEFVALLGASGSGKTTLLRILAGLDAPDTGQAWVPEARTVVFQEPRLLPWATVAENIAFPLKGHKPPVEITRQVDELLTLLGLADFADAYPAQISGGMAQRTALGRALAWEPELPRPEAPVDTGAWKKR